MTTQPMTDEEKFTKATARKGCPPATWNYLKNKGYDMTGIENRNQSAFKPQKRTRHNNLKNKAIDALVEMKNAI